MNPRFKPTICQDIRDAFGGEGDISGALACIVSAVLGEGDISGVLRFWLTSLLQFWLTSLLRSWLTSFLQLRVHTAFLQFLACVNSAVLAYIIPAAFGRHGISAVLAYMISAVLLAYITFAVLAYIISAAWHPSFLRSWLTSCLRF